MKNYVDNVEKFIAEAGKIKGEIEREKFEFGIRDSLSYNEPRPESPIEQILYTAITLVRGAYDIDTEVGDAIYLGINGEGAMSVEAQVKIGKYRADFLISSIFKGEVTSFVVECDGHAFHDRSEKERRYEKQRDRFFQRQGYKVFHFTGAEIVKNPYKVACEIIAEAQGIRPNYIIDSIIDFIPNQTQQEELKELYIPIPNGEL